MNATAELARTDVRLSDEMLRLLRYAVTDQRGHLHMLRLPDISRTHRDAATLALINLGYAKWQDFYDAVITEAGRIAIGAPPVLGDERWKAEIQVVRDVIEKEKAERIARYEAADHSQSFLNRPPPEAPPEAVLARLRKPKNFSRRRVCVEMAILETRTTGVFASTDGSREKMVFLPFNARVKIEAQHGPKWAAISMSGRMFFDRKLGAENASDLPAPRPDFPPGHPDHNEFYAISEDGYRASTIQSVRRRNDALRPKRTHQRGNGSWSPW
jgi:hypothetical protein